MKKLFTFLASAALCLLPPAASAADNQTIDGIDYHFNASTETYTVAGESSSTSEVAFLAMVDGYPVTSIAESVFETSLLTSLSMPWTITEIGQGAFRSCRQLQHVTLSPSITEIPNICFAGCGVLEECVVPEGVTTIGESAFEGCSTLESLILPSTITTLNAHCFAIASNSCVITCYAATPPNADQLTFTGYKGKVAVPAASVDAYKTATGWSTVASKIEAIPTPEWPVTLDGVTYNLTPDSGSAYVTGFTNRSKQCNVTIQKMVQGLPVTSIDARALNHSWMTTVAVPATVTEIGANACADCTYLTAVSLPSGLTKIADDLFSYCTKLAKCDIPEGVATIGQRAFDGCKALLSLTLPATVNNLGTNCFRGMGTAAGSDATTLTCLATTPPNADPQTFTGYSGKVAVPSASVDAYKTATGWSTVASQIEAISTPTWPVTIGGVTYNSTPDSGTAYVTSTDGNATGNVTIQKEVLGLPVTLIDADAFSNCSGLESVYIPETVKSIGSNAFKGCSNLSSISIEGEGLETIGSNAFKECLSLTEITIPRSVTAIDQNVFSGCIRLENVTLPETITYIGSEAFQDCGQLQSIVLPEQLVSIGENAFNGCTGLTSVTLNDGLQRIGANAFSGCNSLTEITIPENVTSIASEAFYNCSSLERVYIKGQIRSINSSTFAQCPELSAIVLPATLDQIVDNAFSGSNALKRVILFGAPAAFTQPNATASTKTIDDIFGAGAKFYVPSSLEVQYTAAVTNWSSAELQTYSFSMTVSPDKIQSLAVGKSQKLTAGLRVKRHSDVEEIVVPEFSTILGQAIWTSGNNSVATVSADGTVTGIREGTTAIQVETPYSRTQTSGTSDQNTVLPTVYATCPVYITVPTGIETAVSDTAAPKVYAANGEVRIEGAEPGAEVRVYDLSGRCLLTTSEHTFAAPGNGGVCILTVGGRTYKFAL